MDKRFHQLVTSPHAWRSAFARFFPGAEALGEMSLDLDFSSQGSGGTHSAKRAFTPLTLEASWRTEYIFRTQLLRALGRGKPYAQITTTGASSKLSSGQSANAQLTYNSHLVSPVSKLHANFGPSVSKFHPRFIHGADDVGTASRSDPRQGKVDHWGFQDTLAFRQFVDLNPSEEPYGLGSGDIVGVPNCMDVSHAFGMVYGEGHGHDSVLWFRHTDEKRGRALTKSTSLQEPEHGIPDVSGHDPICSVWIAKSTNLPELSGGSMGIMAGSAAGVLTTYSAGTNGIGNTRFERGQISCRWVLCPGVPIIAISVDEHMSPQRLIAGRVWAMALNALGEVYYLDSLPMSIEKVQSLSLPYNSLRAQQHLERSAWAAGRTVAWKLVEATRRVSRVEDPADHQVNGSYTPRSSSIHAHVSQEQLLAETREIENFMQKKPKDFRKCCQSWDMCRRLEVDFAGTDKNLAGETVLIMNCGSVDDLPISILRFTRQKTLNPSPTTAELAASRSSNICQAYEQQEASSLSRGDPTWSFTEADLEYRGTKTTSSAQQEAQWIEEWTSSELTFGRARSAQITSSALDNSICATITSIEKSRTFAGGGDARTSTDKVFSSTKDIPGEQARLLAVGTKGGTIYLYNVRASCSPCVEVQSSIGPLRVINTGSPQISCLALSALYLVHGGNDGLVQAWDPLASTTEPLRTLNSRFSSRARRRLLQAEASAAGVGLNMFAAGAIILHPDPTVLCGMVSLGSHLRFWSYSSDSAEQYRGNKRRPRRSERGSNQGPDHFSGTGRGALKDYIANERLELERERKAKRREEERLVGRFGVNLLGPGASEDEILAYATLLSEEAAKDDEIRRQSADSSNSSLASTVDSPLEPGVDDDLAQALQRSLQTPDTDRHEGPSIPLMHSRAKHSPPATFKQVSALEDEEDLHYALQLSLAEQASRIDSAKGKEREA